MSQGATVDPHNPWLAHAVRIAEIRSETVGVATYDLVFEDQAVADAYRFRPGQFNMVYLPGLGEIAISVSGDPAGRSSVPHTIREAGNVTRTLAQLAVGSAIGLRGPFGSYWPLADCLGCDIVLVAGGIGLAPLRPAVCALLSERERFGRLSVLIGAREPALLLYRSEFSRWRECGIDVQVTVDRAGRDWHGDIGTVTALLDRLTLDDPSRTRMMTCGPAVMMWYAIQGALGRGLRPESVFVSLERNMNCAIGLCGHCQFGSQFVCRDGPVLRYDRVASIFRMDDL